MEQLSNRTVKRCVASRVGGHTDGTIRQIQQFRNQYDYNDSDVTNIQ